MDTIEIIIQLLVLIGFMYHFTKYNVNSPTPYHGIMAMILLMMLGFGAII